jgi:hypothetical protein
LSHLQRILFFCSTIVFLIVGTMASADESGEPTQADPAPPSALASPGSGESTTETADPPTEPAVVETTAPSTAIGVTFSDPITSNWQVGFQAAAVRQAAMNLFVTIPVPREWPEQSVSVVDETIPTEASKVRDRELNGGVRQVTVAVPRLQPRTEVRFLMTYQVRTSQINPPADPTVFLKPKSSHRDGKTHLGTSPQINPRNSKIRKLVKQLTADQPTPWQEVETIYNWVRDNVELRDGDARDIDNVFKDRHGCAEDLTGLFVGMCRANKIPARIVWVTGSQYAEFMLIDETKQAHWFPCLLVGPREFGGLSEPRIILQKGDSIKVPEKKQRQKYVAEFATCKGNVKPVVRFVRRQVPVE